MVEINVKESDKTEKGWIFNVTLTYGDKKKNFVVTISNEFQQILWAKPDVIVRESFKFLLENEMPDTIFPEFDIADIEKYYPGYFSEIKKRLI